MVLRRLLFDWQREPGKLNAAKTLRLLSKHLNKILRTNISLIPKRERYLSIMPCNFMEVTRQYIRSIIMAGCKAEHEFCLLNQPFAPSDPQRYFKYFDDPYAIVVDRDPRDLYIMAKYIYRNRAEYIPTERVEDYVKWHTLVHLRTCTKSDCRVLHIKFEDMCYEYQNTRNLIEGFLAIEENDESSSIFNPNDSIANTQVFREYEREEKNITYIEQELKEYLYPFENYNLKINHSNLERLSFL